MFKLDEMAGLDKHRKELIHDIKMLVYDWIEQQKIINEKYKEELNGCRVKIEHYSIILRPYNRLSDDLVKCFEDEFSVTLVRIMENKVENICDDNYMYPVGIYVDLRYIFKSSGGLY